MKKKTWGREVLLEGEHVGQLLYRNMQRFRGGLVFEAHRLLYHSRATKKKKKTWGREVLLEGEMARGRST